MLQIFRYTFVGGAAFVADFLTLFVLTGCVGIHYMVSANAAFVFGSIVNYLLARKFVFSNSCGLIKNKKAEMLVYGLIGVPGLLLNDVIIYFLTENIGLYYLASKAIAAIVVYMFNFFIRKRFLFK